MEVSELKWVNFFTLNIIGVNSLNRECKKIIFLANPLYEKTPTYQNNIYSY